MEKPKYLYRGIVLEKELFEKTKIKGVDMYPPNEYQIDEFGKKVDKSGNEFGLYMTDNYGVAEQSYGNPRYGTIFKTNFNIYCNNSISFIEAPSIGIIYKIDTGNLNIRLPKIRDVYERNNGVAGEEWISDMVPSQNYSIVKMVIGSDILHPNKLELDVTNIDEALSLAKRILKKRYEQIEELYYHILRNNPEKKDLRITDDDIELYKELFGDDGIEMVDYEQKKLQTGYDYYMYLFLTFYNNETSNNSLIYELHYIKDELSDSFTLEDLQRTLNEKLKKIQNKMQLLEQKNDTLVLENYAKSEKRIKEIISTLNWKIHKNHLKEIEHIIRNELRVVFDYEFLLKRNKSLEEVLTVMNKRKKGVEDRIDTEYKNQRISKTTKELYFKELEIEYNIIIEKIQEYYNNNTLDVIPEEFHDAYDNVIEMDIEVLEGHVEPYIRNYSNKSDLFSALDRSREESETSFNERRKVWNAVKKVYKEDGEYSYFKYIYDYLRVEELLEQKELMELQEKKEIEKIDRIEDLPRIY